MNDNADSGASHSNVGLAAEEDAFEAFSDTWSDEKVWHGPDFWVVWQAACKWQPDLGG